MSSYSLNRFSCADTYSDTTGGLFGLPPIGKLRVNVESNPAYMQWEVDMPGNWMPEQLVRQGADSFPMDPPVSSVRFRNANPGQAALVSVTALTEGSE
jgi:hypothetical protein